MSYLIDTNVICELSKKNPNPEVVEWFNSVPDRDLYLSVLTLGEIRKGLSGISSAAQKEKIRLWLEHELTNWFDGRILSIDQDVAHKWGLLQTQTKRTLPAIDSLIAATALHADLAIVTRNAKDFDYQSLEVINPFSNS